MTKLQMVTEMIEYVSRLRNTEKKDYALRYALWLLRGPEHRETIVEPQPFHLSYVGAQAVRMALHTIERKAATPTP